MKLTKREKRLIVVLIILVASIAYFKFILQPPLNKIKELSEARDNKNLKVKQLKNQLKLKEKISDEYKILGYKINNISSRYFSEIDQERIIIILDEIIKKSGLRESSISFSDISIKDITNNQEVENQETYLHDLAGKIKDDNLESEKESEVNSVNSDENVTENLQVEGMTAIVNYEGSYNQLLSFLSLIEQNEYKIVINMLNAVMNEGLLQGSIVLDFYAIPNVINTDDEMTKWDNYRNYGKDNPFSVLSDLSGNTFTEESLVKYQSDFIMIVKPLSSDVPALTLGKNMDRVGETNIYADNSGIEDVNVYFLQKEGKLYYKYKSEKYAYPEDFNKWVEFTPYSDNINIKVYSEKRNSLEDVSGVNVFINNDTNYKVIVTIVNDDIERPRVRIQKEKGKIEVVNN